MDINETTRICKAIASIKPAQYLDDETPAFWSLILADIRYEDARQAVVTLGGKTKFIDPSDIITEVKRIRNERLKHSDLIIADSPEERRAIIKAIADGEIEGPKPASLMQVHPAIAAALPTVFARPPRPIDVAATGGATPKPEPKPERALTAEQAAEIDATRQRTLAALEAMGDGAESGGPE